MTSLFWQRRISSAFSTPWQQILNSFRSAESASAFQSIPKPVVPWNYQQIRPRARGNEYQPSNIKRKHKHGWIRRIRSAKGIEVILRRMLKGRKSLTH
ncbi:Mrpl34: 39S ribosomal protein L34 mitochondrial [Crotalus adamanteus]|uniref:Large ribosomal subunit protein bL34m n=1 Tax=Crotalus adamanteus TaxID=8729 RepID=A0AAW1C497_CROAD|nr:39S ribosomal protein L34, mitochondrial [Crotalus tigris]XP_039190634.1 39S ribosomal protein L34, mitochondrial [Crotalus tigris]